VKRDKPMTVRQVFYQLVVRGVIEKTEKEYNGTVIRLLTDMRLAGELPFDWIIDESRRRLITQAFDSLEDALEDTAKFYRRSALRDADDYLEVWVEKEALSGLVYDVASEYDVPVMVSKGMPSLTFLHSCAKQIRAASRRGKTTYIYQFGDHDPSGVLIPRTIQARLDEICDMLKCPAGPVVQRVALTEDQIRRFRLPTRPTKRDGNRHADSFDGDSVELDALPPDELRSMVRAAVEEHISPRAVEILRAAEESERDLIRSLAESLP
jgi:hypothetical protein